MPRNCIDDASAGVTQFGSFEGSLFFLFLFSSLLYGGVVGWFAFTAACLI